MNTSFFIHHHYHEQNKMKKRTIVCLWLKVLSQWKKNCYGPRTSKKEEEPGQFSQDHPKTEHQCTSRSARRRKGFRTQSSHVIRFLTESWEVKSITTHTQHSSFTPPQHLHPSKLSHLHCRIAREILAISLPVVNIVSTGVSVGVTVLGRRPLQPNRTVVTPCSKTVGHGWQQAWKNKNNMWTDKQKGLKCLCTFTL